MVEFSLVHSLLGFLGCESWARLILVDDPVYYRSRSTVTGWGCAWCLQTGVGEGRAHEEIFNPLPGKSSSCVC